MIQISNSARQQEKANLSSLQLRQPEAGTGEVHEETGEALFRAGDYVVPGTYIEIETGRSFTLTGEDYLPARLDGKVAWYRLSWCMWEEMPPVVDWTGRMGAF